MHIWGTKLLFLLLALLILSGCTSARDRYKELTPQIAQEINCKKAENDIAMLKEARTGVLERISNGIATVLPTTAIVNLLSGEYSSRRAIATGEFNAALYDKIMEIETSCLS